MPRGRTGGPAGACPCQAGLLPGLQAGKRSGSLVTTHCRLGLPGPSVSLPCEDVRASRAGTQVAGTVPGPEAALHDAWSQGHKVPAGSNPQAQAPYLPAVWGSFLSLSPGDVQSPDVAGGGSPRGPLGDAANPRKAEHRALDSAIVVVSPHRSSGPASGTVTGQVTAVLRHRFAVSTHVTSVQTAAAFTADRTVLSSLSICKNLSRR